MKNVQNYGTHNKLIRFQSSYSPIQKLSQQQTGDPQYKVREKGESQLTAGKSRFIQQGSDDDLNLFLQRKESGNQIGQIPILQNLSHLYQNNQKLMQQQEQEYQILDGQIEDISSDISLKEEEDNVCEMMGETDYDSGMEEEEDNSLLYQKAGLIDGDKRVYEGIDLNFGGLIAIKTYDKEFAENMPLNINICEQVFKLQVDYENNFCKYYYIVQNEDEGIDIPMEFMAGSSIKSLLKTFRRFNPQLVAFYVKQILEGLAILHENQIFHGSIKPSNILVSQAGHIKLTDVNIFEMNYTTTSLLRSLYSAPEVLLYNTFTQASDIWAVGIVLLEMIFGKIPWINVKGSICSLEEIISRLQQKKMFPLPQSLPAKLKRFLQLIFKFNPDHRPTANYLLNHEYLQDVPSDRPQSISISKQQKAEYLNPQNQNLEIKLSSQIIDSKEQSSNTINMTANSSSHNSNVKRNSIPNFDRQTMNQIRERNDTNMSAFRIKMGPPPNPKTYLSMQTEKPGGTGGTGAGGAKLGSQQILLANNSLLFRKNGNNSSNKSLKRYITQYGQQPKTKQDVQANNSNLYQKKSHFIQADSQYQTMQNSQSPNNSPENSKNLQGSTPIQHSQINKSRRRVSIITRMEDGKCRARQSTLNSQMFQQKDDNKSTVTNGYFKQLSYKTMDSIISEKACTLADVKQFLGNKTQSMSYIGSFNDLDMDSRQNFHRQKIHSQEGQPDNENPAQLDSATQYQQYQYYQRYESHSAMPVMRQYSLQQGVQGRPVSNQPYKQVGQPKINSQFARVPQKSINQHQQRKSVGAIPIVINNGIIEYVPPNSDFAQQKHHLGGVRKTSLFVPGSNHSPANQLLAGNRNNNQQAVEKSRQEIEEALMRELGGLNSSSSSEESGTPNSNNLSKDIIVANKGKSRTGTEISNVTASASDNNNASANYSQNTPRIQQKQIDIMRKYSVSVHKNPLEEDSSNNLQSLNPIQEKNESVQLDIDQNQMLQSKTTRKKGLSLKISQFPNNSQSNQYQNQQSLDSSSSNSIPFYYKNNNNKNIINNNNNSNNQVLTLNVSQLTSNPNSNSKSSNGMMTLNVKNPEEYSMGMLSSNPHQLNANFSFQMQDERRFSNLTATFQNIDDRRRSSYLEALAPNSFCQHHRDTILGIPSPNPNMMQSRDSSYLNVNNGFMMDSFRRPSSKFGSKLATNLLIFAMGEQEIVQDSDLTDATESNDGYFQEQKIKQSQSGSIYNTNMPQKSQTQELDSTPSSIRNKTTSLQKNQTHKNLNKNQLLKKIQTVKSDNETLVQNQQLVDLLDFDDLTEDQTQVGNNNELKHFDEENEDLFVTNINGNVKKLVKNKTSEINYTSIANENESSPISQEKNKNFFLSFQRTIGSHSQIDLKEKTSRIFMSPPSSQHDLDKYQPNSAENYKKPHSSYNNNNQNYTSRSECKKSVEMISSAHQYNNCNNTKQQLGQQSQYNLMVDTLTQRQLTTYSNEENYSHRYLNSKK